MAAFLKLSIAVFALLAVHLTLADHSYPDVDKSPISTDAAESRSDVEIPEELSHLKPGESLYFYYEPIQNQKHQAHPSHYGHQRRRQEGPPQQQQQRHPQQQQLQPRQPLQQQQQPQQQQQLQPRQQQQQQQLQQQQQQQQQFQRNPYNPYQQRVGRPLGLVDRIRNMFSFNPFWRNQISRQLEVVAASPLIAGAVVAGITALAGGLVYTQGILSEPAPVVTPAPPISNFRPAVTTRVVNRIVSAIENQASIELSPDRYSARPLADDEITTTTPLPAIAENGSEVDASEVDASEAQEDIRSSSTDDSTVTPSGEDTTIDETTMAAQSTTDLVDAILGVAQGSEDNEGDNNLLGAGNSPTLDSESDNVVRLGNGDSQSQVQDEGSDDSTESMMETTTGMPDTTAKILKLTMQKASSLYPDMILLPLTQGDSNEPIGTTTMIPDTDVQDEANERVGSPTTTTPRSIEDSENDITTIKAPERVKFGSSDQVIDYIKQLTNNIIDEDPSKPNDNGEERSQPDLLPSANTSDSNPEEGDVVTEALGASNIFDRISLNAEAKEEAEEADTNPTTITNPQGKNEDKIPQYSSWTEWTDCSALCTNDFSDTPPTQKRSRTCLNNCQENQFIAEFESQSCNLRTNCDSLLTSPDLEAPLINRMTDALDGEGRPYSPKIIFGPEYDGIEFLNGLSSTFAPAISYPLRTDLSLPSDLTLMAWLYLNETQVREESKSLPLISLAPKGSMNQGLSLVLLGPDMTLALELANQDTQFFDSKQSVINNQWTQVGVTHSANTGVVQFYLDGQRVGVPIQTSIEGVQFKMSKLMLKPESQLNLAMVNFYQEVLPSELIHTLFHKMKLQERSKLFLTETI